MLIQLYNKYVFVMDKDSPMLLVFATLVGMAFGGFFFGLAGAVFGGIIGLVTYAATVDDLTKDSENTDSTDD